MLIFNFFNLIQSKLRNLDEKYFILNYIFISMSEKDITKCLISSDNGCYLDISVSPNSSESKINGVNIWRDNLEISVKERAQDGEANKGIIELLSESLNIPTNKIEIVKGKATKQKRIFFRSVDIDEIKNKLEKMVS